LLALTLLAGGCSSSSGSGNPTPDSGSVLDASDGASQCQLERLSPPLEPANHVPIWPTAPAEGCTPVTHNSKPPASGTHYPTWAVFRAYDQPVPWGFLVHAMEHGAVVIAYNCPDGCAADVQAAKDVIAAAPARTGCPGAPVILTPDPTLDVRFAAAAWGHILRAPCFDRQAFGDFIAERRDKGPEYFVGDCGASDREAVGWCSR
jgi:hypothetical protein